MNIFQQIKESVTAKQAAEMYGLKVNRNGMTCCPFHKDRHPSMKIDKGYYCFACGAKGDVIHFVEGFYGISPYEAVKKIADDFHIHIDEDKKKQKRKIRKRKKPTKNTQHIKKEFEKWESYCIGVLSEYLHMLEQWKTEYAPKNPDEEWKDEFIEAYKYREITVYYLDILLNGELEDRIDFVLNKGEEVKEIERRMGRYGRETYEKNGSCGQEHKQRLCS